MFVSLNSDTAKHTISAVIDIVENMKPIVVLELDVLCCPKHNIGGIDRKFSDMYQ